MFIFLLEHTFFIDITFASPIIELILPQFGKKMSWLNTGKCRYSAVQFITILHTTVAAITVAESESGFRITTDTPYLALTGELWGVFCEDFAENRVITTPHSILWIIGISTTGLANLTCIQHVMVVPQQYNIRRDKIEALYKKNPWDLTKIESLLPGA